MLRSINQALPGLILLLAIVLTACTTQPANEAPGLDLTDCVLSTPGLDVYIDAHCGSLAVSENPADSSSRQIQLKLAVVPAIKRTPAPDPLFILVGGPGQSAMEIYPALSSALFRIHQGRDIVLVDQRGTGQSNPLRCLSPEDEALDEEQVIAALQACPTKLDADLRYYSTDIAMQDLDAVRSALGYESINLFGASYGTRAALVYLKMHPQHVRSIILDAVVDPTFILYQDAARDGEQALEIFLKRCEVDDACSETYPGLRAELETVLLRLGNEPEEIGIPHPITGKPLAWTITRETFANILFNSLYSPDLVAMLPLAIHEAYTSENYAPLITQAYLLDARIYDGMFYAVACTEDAPRLKLPEEDGSLFAAGARAFMEVCQSWPHTEPPAVVSERVTSDVPVLLLSGEADPITPPQHAERLAASLSNSLHLIFKGMGHGNSTHQCTARILDQFVESGSVEALDVTCVESVEPPPFLVDFSGPQP